MWHWNSTVVVSLGLKVQLLFCRQIWFNYFFELCSCLHYTFRNLIIQICNCEFCFDFISVWHSLWWKWAPHSHLVLYCVLYTPLCGVLWTDSLNQNSDKTQTSPNIRKTQRESEVFIPSDASRGICLSGGGV